MSLRPSRRLSLGLTRRVRTMLSGMRQESQIPNSEMRRVTHRLGAVAGVIFLGCLVAVTLIVTPSLRNPVPVALLDNTLLKMGPSPAFRPSRSSALSEKAPESLPVSDAKLLGLKESDMRLLKGAIHAQKSKDAKTCGIECGGNDPDCVTLCGRPDGKGHAPLPVKDFKKLFRLTQKAAADGGKAFGLEASDVELLQGALKQQAKEQIAACKTECSTADCKQKCHKMVETMQFTEADVRPPAKLASSTGSAQQPRAIGLPPVPAAIAAEHEESDRAPTELEAARMAKAAGIPLPERDLKLLAAAEGDQAKEEAESKSNAAAMKQALRGERHAAAKERGDWAPGMRSGALRGLEKERRDAARTARNAAAADRSDNAVW